MPDEGEGLQGTVILGLDPRIHEETSRVLVARWIAGSHPQGDVKGNDNKKRAQDDEERRG